MKAYGGVDVWIHVSLTSSLVAGELSASRPGRFTPGTHWIGGWVGPRIDLDDVEKRKFLTLPGLKLRPVQSIGCRYTDWAIPAPDDDDDDDDDDMNMNSLVELTPDSIIR
jgi:hypothetical protein